ncbi:MAG: STAS domain-containing protein [Limisphaerales bacterium]
MNLEPLQSNLRVSGLAELNASNAGSFRDQTRAALLEHHTRIDFEFSQTRFLDSSGLGALIALHKTMSARGGHIRILNPPAQVQQILELTRMHRIFEISRE